jgi:uncharacterized membrane protein YkvA (DUF1232 family)
MNEQDSPLSRSSDTFVLKKAKLITKEQIDSVIRKAKAIQQKISESESLTRVLSDVQLCQNLLKDYRAGRYRDVPKCVIAVIALVLLYLVNPIELIPDVIPVIGYLDDVALVAVALKLTKDELRKYSEWKKANEPT